MEENILRHVVLFGFKKEISNEIIKVIEKRFYELKDKITFIYDFEWGINISPEGLSKEHTHCFLVSFLSEKDRDCYLPHPAHKEFVSFINPYLENVLVIDYWVQK